MAEVFYHIIFNPAAAAGNSVAALKLARKLFDERQIPYKVRVSRYDGHTIEIAKQIASVNQAEKPVVLVIGGDGTLNQTITGLREAGVDNFPIAYLPAGSGNDFARAVGISNDLNVALQQIIETTDPVILDIGEYREKNRGDHGFFVNNIGVGFDAAVIASTSHSNYKRLLNRARMGNLTYIFGTIGTLFTGRPFSATVHVNGKYEIIPNALLVVTTNHPFFGGGVTILPDAVPTDGALDLLIVEYKNFFHFVSILVRLLSGKALPPQPAVHHYRSSHLRLETSSLEFGQMDGEELGSRPFDLSFTVNRQAFWFSKAANKASATTKG